jgi:hypothetical protein
LAAVIRSEGRQVSGKPTAISCLLLDIGGVLFTDYRSTCEKLASFGLQDDEALARVPDSGGIAGREP